jgi:hypothetical protein
MRQRITVGRELLVRQWGRMSGKPSQLNSSAKNQDTTSLDSSTRRRIRVAAKVVMNREDRHAAVIAREVKKGPPEDSNEGKWNVEVAHKLVRIMN